MYRTHSSPSGHLPTDQLYRAPSADSQGTFYNDHSQSDAETTPTATSALDGSFTNESTRDPGYDDFIRRPSHASAATVASQASRSTTNSGRLQKRLQGFFGDEYHSPDSQPPPPKERSISPRVSPRNGSASLRSRKGSSPSVSSDQISRPITPLPSSTVTPWDFQNFTVSRNISQTLMPVLTETFTRTSPTWERLLFVQVPLIRSSPRLPAPDTAAILPAIDIPGARRIERAA